MRAQRKRKKINKYEIPKVGTFILDGRIAYWVGNSKPIIKFDRRLLYCDLRARSVPL